jgi:hypothetical protein
MDHLWFTCFPITQHRSLCGCLQAPGPAEGAVVPKCNFVLLLSLRLPSTYQGHWDALPSDSLSQIVPFSSAQQTPHHPWLAGSKIRPILGRVFCSSQHSRTHYKPIILALDCIVTISKFHDSTSLNFGLALQSAFCQPHMALCLIFF